MSGSRDEAERLYGVAAAEGIERLYDVLGGMLQRTVSDRFGIPAEDARSLVHDAFTAYLISGVTVNDPEAWLIAAVCHSAMTYRRAHASVDESVTPRDATMEQIQSIRDVLFLQDAIATLPERAREAVRLRFSEKITNADIAAQLGVSEFYVQNAVKKAVLKLRKLQRQRKAER
jgi:RNA polymerase sigma factor (sigma-70 family)